MGNSIALQLITGALGGAFVTGIVGPYVLNQTERRKYRAEVLNALMDVETGRWASKNSDYTDFRKVATKLRSTALVAGISSDIVDSYVYLAAVARSESQRDYDEVDDESNPFAGGIPTKLSDLARASAEVLIFNIRHPIKTYFNKGKMLKDINKQTKDLRRLYKKQNPEIVWDIKSLEV